MLKIMIADDDEATRDALLSLVDIFGHTGMGASNGNEVLGKHTAFKPDLIVLDHNMGSGMTGLDVLGVLKKEEVNSYVVMLTGNGDVELAVKAMKLGAFDFISKPLDIIKMEELFNKISNLKNNATTAVIRSLEEIEKITIKKAIDQCATFQEAANMLGINVVTLHRKRKAYGIHCDGFANALKEIEKLINAA